MTISYESRREALDDFAPEDEWEADDPFAAEAGWEALDDHEDHSSRPSGETGWPGPTGEGHDAVSPATELEALEDDFAAPDAWPEAEWEKTDSEAGLAAEGEWAEDPFATETAAEPFDDHVGHDDHEAFEDHEHDGHEPEDTLTAEDDWEAFEALAVPEGAAAGEDQSADEDEDEDDAPGSEADAFLPVLAAGAARMAAPWLLGKVATPVIRKVAPVATRAVGSVVGTVLRNLGLRRARAATGGVGRAAARAGGPRRGPRLPRRPTGSHPRRPVRRPPVPRRPRRPALPRQVPMAPPRTVSKVVDQSRYVLDCGEDAARELEDEVLPEIETEADVEVVGEAADSEVAAEVALTEHLAAEAALAEDETEAQSLVAASLPVMAERFLGPEAARQLLLPLTESNSDLVHGMRAGGPATHQLVRLQPAIMRRTLGSLAAALQQGHGADDALVARLLAGQAARVLGDRRQVARAVKCHLKALHRPAPSPVPTIDAARGSYEAR